MQLLHWTALFFALLLTGGTYLMSDSIKVRQLASLREAPHSAFVCAHLLYWNGKEKHEYLKHFTVPGNQLNIILFFPLLLFFKMETPSAIGHSAPLRHSRTFDLSETNENDRDSLVVAVFNVQMLSSIKAVKS